MKRLSGPALTRLVPLLIALACITVAALLYLVGPGLLDSLEFKTYDLRLQSRGTLTPSPNILLCVIDEKSLREQGRWPWPRWKIAKLVDKLSEMGAKVIAFDIGFFEPDINMDDNILEVLEARIKKGEINKEKLISLLEQTKRGFNNDLLLAKSIRRSKARVVLGYFFHMNSEKLDYKVDHSQLLRQLSLIEASKYPVVIYRRHRGGSSPITKAFAPVPNLEQLVTAADSCGYFNIFPDNDGVVRRIPLAIQCRADVYSPLSIQALWNAMDRPPLSVVVSGFRVLGIKMGKLFVPTDKNGNLIVNFLGPPGTFPNISASDILAGRIQESRLKGSIVFVGVTAVGVYDQRATPFSAVYPGLEVHATVADNILKQRYILKPSWTDVADLGSVVLLGLLAALALWLLGPYRAAFICAGLLGIHISVCTFLLWFRGTWLNIVYPTVSLSMTYGLLAMYYYVTQEKDKKRLKVAFHHYVSPVAVRQILKKPGEVSLSGDRKELTVLFSDLRGFTKMSQGTSPRQVVSQLNEYLTTMTDIVFDSGGTLDKYMGDGLMAIFGAPVPLEDHPRRACEAAIRMVQALDELNARWIPHGKPSLDVGIGISTGVMLVGNLGSRQRFDYTVLGESVNLGAKLEGLSAYYGVQVLISEPTYVAIKGQFRCFEVDVTRLQDGNTMKIYSLIAKEISSATKQEALTYFETGLRYYKIKDWAQAVEMFRKAYEIDPSLRVAEIYFRRSHYLLKNPPPPNWDGVWTTR